MTNDYVNKALNIIGELNNNAFDTFCLLYGLIYCDRHLGLSTLTHSIECLNIEAIKNEAVNELNEDIFIRLDTANLGCVKIIEWLRKNPPLSPIEDVLGALHLTISEEAKRKKLGEHYTNQELINIIFDEIDIENNLNNNLIDPACGSGNFLVCFVSRLLFKCKDSNTTNETIRKIFDRELISGVDIQDITCLIAKIRLLMIIVDFSKVGYPCKSIPVYQLDTLIEGESEILTDNQYDIVATNPPYLRYHSLDDKLRNIYKKSYYSAKGKYDIYTLFIEKSIRLAKKKSGKISIVCSDKFMASSYGEAIRSFVINNTNLVKVLDLSAIYPFDAAVLSAIYFFDNTVEAAAKEAAWEKLFWENNTAISREVGTIGFEDIWRYKSTQTENLFKKVIEHPDAKILKDYCKSILVGLQTTADSVFCKSMTNEFIEKNNIEKKLVFPMLRGRNLKKWGYEWSGKKVGVDTFVLYPYDEENNITKKIRLLQYPNVMKYLLDNKHILESRTYFESKSTKEWFEHWVERTHKTFRDIKILTPDLASECRFSLDTKGFFYNGTVYSIKLENNFKEDDYKYLLGVLNSNLILFCHKQLNPLHLQSKKYRFQSPIMKKYPIIFLDKNDDMYVRIVSLVDEIMKKARKRENIKNKEVELNNLIYEVYTLTHDETKVIENFLNENEMSSQS